jgi:hypothetical protein
VTVPRGVEYTGLRETAAALKKLGVPDDAVKTAMNEAGMIVAREAWRIGPSDTGKMLSTLKVNKSKSLLKINVGGKSAPYAYSWHALELGVSKGGFNYKVPAHQRKGHPVRAYRANRALPAKGQRPFLFTAWERKKQEVLAAYVTAMGDLFRQVMR